MTFGERLSCLRKERGMTQTKLAEELGIRRQSVSMWERELTKPSTENLIAIGKVLNVPVEVLTGNTLSRQSPPDAQTVPKPEPEQVPAAEQSRPGFQMFKKRVVSVVLCVVLVLAIAIGFIVYRQRTEITPLEELKGGEKVEIDETFSLGP